MTTDYQPRYQNSYALLIGIDSYSDPRFAPLGEAEADARALAEVLAASPHNFQVTLLLGQQATRRAILKALFDLRNTQPDDRILVYFAGHGYTLTDRFGAETGYLAAVDTIPEQDFTALELEEVTALCRHAPAKHIGFIFDACFSGQALGLTRAPGVAAGKLLTRRAYQVISAGAGDQTVSDYRSMTDLLVEALRSDPTGEGASLTLNNLGLLVQQQMAADSGNTQIPQFGHLRGSQGGDMVFGPIEGLAVETITVAPTPMVAAPVTSVTTPLTRPVATLTTLPLWARIGLGFLAMVVVVGIGALLALAPGGGQATPTPGSPTPTLSVATIGAVQKAVTDFDREMRYVLETLDTSRISRFATGSALEGRLNAVNILTAAGNCTWDYTHRGIEFVSFTPLSPTQVEVEAIVDRDGTVFCGTVERSEYAFKGPYDAIFVVELLDGRWIVSDYHPIN